MKKIPLLLLSCTLILPYCKALKLNIDDNCLNVKASCFKPDKTAPYLVSSTPPAASLQSLLPTIQLDFSEEMSDATNASHYALVGPGAATLSIASIQRIAPYSVLITTSGKVSSGLIQINFMNLTDYGGNSLTGATTWSLTGNVQIPIVIDTINRTGVSNNGGAGGYNSVTLNWHHEYSTDGNNEYAVWVTQQPASTPPERQADCASFWANKATNLPLASGSPIAASAPQVTTLPVGNFTLGVNQVLICVRNLSQNKFGGLARDIVRDDTRPLSTVSPGAAQQGTPISVTLACSDNADRIAYTIDGAVPAFTAGALTTGSLYTGAWSVPADAAPHTLRWLCIDQGGNVESSAGSSIYLYDPSLPSITLGTITHTSISSAAGAYTSTQVSWSADQFPRIYSLRKDGTCNLSASDLTTSTNVTGTYTGGAFPSTTITAADLTSGAVNQIRLCVYNAANTNPGFITFNITRDNTGPTAIAAADILPADIAVNVAGNTAITVNFSEPMDISTLTTATDCSGSISLSSNGFASCIAGTLNVSQNPSITFTPTVPLPYLATGTYKVRITGNPSGVRDAAGNLLAVTYEQPNGFTVAFSMLRRYTFDNGSLIDLQNSGYDFTAMNNPAAVAGADGDTNGAYNFTAAATQYLQAADTALPIGAAPRTLCAWVNPSSYPNPTFNTVFAVYGSAVSTNDRFGFGQRNTANTNQLCMFVDNVNRCANYTMPLKSWSHVCASYDGASIRMYANGVLVLGPTAVTLNTALSSMRAGAYFDLTSPFDGKIDDIRIYNGSLTQNQIIQLAVQIPSGLMAYYPFSNAPATPALDASGNARNATVFGTPTASADYFTPGNLAYTFGGSSTRFASATQVPMGTSNAALSAWVRWTGNLTGADQVVVYNGNSGNKGFGLLLYAGSGAPSNLAVLCGGVSITDFRYKLNAGDWTHVVLQSPSAGNWQLHVNGTLQYSGSGCAMNAADSGQVTIGNNEVPDRPFAGDIDDVRVYNRTLTTSEITTLASQQSTVLVRQYSFAAGGNLTDSVSGGYPLSATGTPLGVSGIDADAAGAYRFDVSTNYYSSTAMNLLPLGNNARTFCTWVNPAGYSVTHYNPASYGGTAANDPQGLAVYGTAGNAAYHYGAGASLISTSRVPLNTWSQLCGTYDGSSLTLYLNGAWVGQNTPGTLVTSAGQFNLGSWAAAAGPAHLGKVDDVRVYYGALSAAQVRSTSILVPSGLVAYFPFTARTITDDSRNGHAGTFVGGMSAADSTSDRFNFAQNAFTFNGSSQAIKASDINLPEGAADSTQCAFMRPRSLPAPGIYMGIVSYGTTATGRRRGLMLYDNAGVPNIAFTGYFADLLIPYKAPLNIWTHICGVYSGGIGSVFINGVQVGSSQALAWTTVNSAGIWIGAGMPPEDWYFDGDLDEIRIYNRALSAAEMRLLAGNHPMQVSAPASNYRFHLQAASYSLLTDGTTISSTWPDTASNPLANGLVNGSPLLASSSNGINGRESISFNATNSYFNFGTPSITTNGLTLCGVYTVSATAAVWGGLIEKRDTPNCPSGGNPSNLCSFGWLQAQGTNNTKFETVENTTPTQLAPGLNTPTMACFVATGTAAVSSQFQSGTNIGYGAGGSGSLGNSATNSYPLTVGKRSISAEYFGGKIGDLVLFTTPLSAPDRERVECYLSAKYSLPLAASIVCP